MTTSTPGEKTWVMSRMFDAPRDLVFRVYTDPKHIAEWWGPARYLTEVDRMEVRVGGVWRFISRDEKKKQEFAFNGRYLEVSPPSRLVYTFEYEGTPGQVVTETVTFEAVGQKTKVTASAEYMTPEDMAGMAQSGMESGAIETWDRLAALLSRLHRP